MLCIMYVLDGCLNLAEPSRDMGHCEYPQYQYRVKANCWYIMSVLYRSADFRVNKIRLLLSRPEKSLSVLVGVRTLVLTVHISTTAKWFLLFPSPPRADTSVVNTV
jgi:hypothetical protein